MQVFSQRSAKLAVARDSLRTRRDRLHAHRAEGMSGIDEAQVVGRDADAEDPRGALAPFPLVLGEGDEFLQRLERTYGVALLPAPIGPFGVGGIGEKASSACALHRGKLRA